jgi:fructose-1,6-bisphosphatase I
MPNSQMTFRQFLMQADGGKPVAGDLAFLLEDIVTACRLVSDHIRNGAFANVLGSSDSTNIQGETQKKLDVIADEEFMRHCANSGRVAALVSEEVDDVHWLKEKPEAGDYLVYFDPLDGSSNVDVNLSVGSIFSIVQLAEAVTPSPEAVLRKGTEQVCAGYAIYGPSTGLVLTVGNGVHGFTQDLGTGEFLLTQPDMTVPATTSEYAINTSRAELWEAPVRRYIDECVAGKNGVRGRTFNMRWTASMVADVHRILTRGGVFLYPMDSGNASTGGKLRLMYEANPMGMIIEQAGGAASTGRARIMEVQPEGHHQRVPVILGSKDEVALIDSYHA